MLTPHRARCSEAILPPGRVGSPGSAATATKGATVAQLAIGWVLSRETDVVPLIGARRRAALAVLRALDDERFCRLRMKIHQGSRHRADGPVS